MNSSTTAPEPVTDGQDGYPELHLLIDGERLAAGGRDTLPVLNPATSAVIGQLPVASEADLSVAVEAAANAFDRWRTTSAFDRAGILRGAAALLRTSCEKLAKILTLEQGKPLAEARSELDGAANVFDWFAEEGRRAYASRLLMPVHQPRTFLTPAYQGTLGWGYATELGAKVACPAAPVVSVSGDGGFMLNVQELVATTTTTTTTAVQHNIPVVAIVFDDGAFGNVRRLQSQQFGRNIASDLKNPDFVAQAKSFCMAAVRLERAAELETAIKEGIASNWPLLIHVSVGSMPDPWKFINMPHVH